VFELASDKIEPPPRIGMRWKSGFLQGIGKRNDLLLIVLDIDKVFSSSELAMLQDIDGGKPSPSAEMAINTISQTGR
jgi:purine-binding chemotaxis protein CheW